MELLEHTLHDPASTKSSLWLRFFERWLALQQQQQQQLGQYWIRDIGMVFQGIANDSIFYQSVSSNSRQRASERTSQSHKTHSWDLQPYQPADRPVGSGQKHVWETNRRSRKTRELQLWRREWLRDFTNGDSDWARSVTSWYRDTREF